MICTFKPTTPFQSGPRRHRPHPSNITSFSVWEKEKKEKRNLGTRGVGLSGDRRADRTCCWESCVLSVRWPCATTTMEMSLRFEATCLLCCSFLLLITSSDGRTGLGKGQNSFLSLSLPTSGPLLVLILSPNLRPATPDFFLSSSSAAPGAISWGREYLPGGRGFKRGKLYLRALLILGFVEIWPLN